MKVTRTKVPKVVILEPDVFKDERGYFKEAIAKYHNFDIKQVNQELSYRGVIRGMHVQWETAKLVWVVKGSIFDVAMNISTGEWVGEVLSADNHKQLLIPENFAHGIQTLEEGTIVCFAMSQSYNPDDDWGYNPLSCGIDWPIKKATLSQKDKDAPKFSSK